MKTNGGQIIAFCSDSSRWAGAWPGLSLCYYTASAQTVHDVAVGGCLVSRLYINLVEN